MKRNDPYHWTVTLRGKTRAKKSAFVGRLDEALHEADELESNVAFTFIEYRIVRGKRAKANHIPQPGNRIFVDFRRADPCPSNINPSE